MPNILVSVPPKSSRGLDVLQLVIEEEDLPRMRVEIFRDFLINLPTRLSEAQDLRSETPIEVLHEGIALKELVPMNRVGIREASNLRSPPKIRQEARGRGDLSAEFSVNRLYDITRREPHAQDIIYTFRYLERRELTNDKLITKEWSRRKTVPYHGGGDIREGFKTTKNSRLVNL